MIRTENRICKIVHFAKGLPVSGIMAKNQALAVALSAAEVAENEIKISNIRMTPQYNYGSKSGRNFEGYLQSLTYVVTVALDMERVQKIYKAIVDTKAGEDISLRFFIEKDCEYRKEAKSLAIKDARTTAEILADAAEIALFRQVIFSREKDEHRLADEQPLVDGT